MASHFRKWSFVMTNALGNGCSQVNSCLALSQQFLDPSPVSNPVSCAGATIYKFGINWITKKIYIKKYSYFWYFYWSSAQGVPRTVLLRQVLGTSCRAGIKSEVCGQWGFLKLALPQSWDMVEGYHNSVHLHPVGWTSSRLTVQFSKSAVRKSLTSLSWCSFSNQ